MSTHLLQYAAADLCHQYVAAGVVVLDFICLFVYLFI